MTPEEKLENKTWEILQKIKEEILFQGTLSIIWKQPQKSSQNSFSFEFDYIKGEEVILGKFEEKGVLKITTKKLSSPNLPLCLRPSLPKNTFDYDNELYLNILQPKFDEVYKEYENKFNFAPKIDEIKNDNIDYADILLKKEWEEKWDVLQVIWKACNSTEKKTSVYVFLKDLKIKERTYLEINNIMEKIKNKGCFSRWIGPGTWHDDSYYIIYNINSEKLTEVYQQTKSENEKFSKNYKGKQEKKEKTASLKNKEWENNQIQKITIIEPKNIDRICKFFINNAFKNTKNIIKNSKPFDILIKIQKGNAVEYNKYLFDYFNFNKNCPVYFGGKYKLTSILEEEENHQKSYFGISPNVKINIISELSYTRLQNKKDTKNT